MVSSFVFSAYECAIAYLCEKVGNSWHCGCWKEEIVRIHVYDCVQQTIVCLVTIYCMCLLQYTNEFVLAQSVCVCMYVCVFACVFANTNA